MSSFSSGPGHDKQAVHLVGDDLDAHNWAVGQEQRDIGKHCDVAEVKLLSIEDATEVSRKRRAWAKAVHGKVD